MEPTKPSAPIKPAAQETSPVIIYVNSPGKLTSLLGTINDLPTKSPSLFLDGEGIRDDTVAFLHLHIPTKNVIYRIALHTQRGGVDLSNANKEGVSLRSILESKSIPKVAFDIRHLSGVLFRQHGANLAGLQDLQLMELASRDDGESKKYVAGLGKCVEQDIPPSNAVRKRWFETTNVDEYHTFNLLSHAPRSTMKRIELFPTLWTIYHSRLQRPEEAFWVAQVRWETEARVTESQLPTFKVNGKKHSLGPKVWYDRKLREKEFGDWKKLYQDADWIQFDEE